MRIWHPFPLLPVKSVHSCRFAAAEVRNRICSRRYSEISGFHGIIAGMLVAIKQVTPDTEVTVLQIVKLRAKVWIAFFPQRGLLQHIACKMHILLSSPNVM